MPDPLRIIKKLAITRQYFCDAGGHCGEQFVQLSGYLTTKEYADLVELMAMLS